MQGGKKLIDQARKPKHTHTKPAAKGRQAQANKTDTTRQKVRIRMNKHDTIDSTQEDYGQDQDRRESSR